jgi:predicted DsbA family dithiol-disulfide isomerase
MIKSSLDELAKTEDIEVNWKSFELRPQDGPQLPPDQEQAYKARVEAAWPQTCQTARERFDLEMKTHRWGINSRLALEGAKLAEERGRGEAYHERMFQAHFIDDIDFGDLDLLANLAEEVGLDRPEFVTAIESGAYAAAVDADVAQARAYGLTGVPATIIEEKYLLPGAQPLEFLQQVVDKIKSGEIQQGQADTD